MKKLMLMGMMVVGMAGAWAAEYSRLTVDVSALPKEQAFFGEMILKRAQDRTRFSDAAKTLTVELQLDAAVKGEDAEVAVKGGKAVIRAGRIRGLVYGAGKLLRAATWREKSFSLADGELAFRPAKPIRICYFARHFHNWYHLATAAELKEYIEDLALWGFNGISYHFEFPGVDRAGAIPFDIERFERISREVYCHLRALDLASFGSGGGNQSSLDTPEKYRAVPNSDPKRGNLGFNICPAKPGALKYIIDGREKMFASPLFRDISFDYLSFWPYDEGGCDCEMCRPWGGNGYLRMGEELSKRNRIHQPEAKSVVSTWTFHDDEWELLYKYLATEESKWIDVILADSHTEFPQYPLTHKLPRPVPIITFPEISMWGRFPWGAFGATALPGRFERLFRQVEKVASGFMCYSEGRFEDLNKIVVLGLYVDPTRHWQEIVREYCRWEFPGVDPDSYVRFVGLLEGNHEFPPFGAELKPENEIGHGELPDVGDYERRCREGLSAATEAEELADELEHQITFSMRPCWRWRLMRLRAIIDHELYGARKWNTPKADRCYRELQQMYLAEPLKGLYRNRSGHGAVRPWGD